MKIKPCPVCGRKPKIRECVALKGQKRRRMIGCPNYCTVITLNDHYHAPIKDSWFIYIGDGDDNTLYKIWNDRI